MLPVPYGEDAAISPDGRTLAYTPSSVNDRTWKRYRGGWAQDIWLFDLQTKAAKKITDWEGTDTLPMWNDDGKTLFYLSDNGPEHRLNLWKYDLASGKRRQVTKYSDYDVKWPSIGGGAVVFQHGAELVLFDAKTEAAAPVKITIPGDKPALRPKVIDASKFLAGFSLAPSAKRVALGARGDIWTAPAKDGTPRNPHAHERRERARPALESRRQDDRLPLRRFGRVRNLRDVRRRTERAEEAHEREPRLPLPRRLVARRQKIDLLRQVGKSFHFRGRERQGREGGQQPARAIERELVARFALADLFLRRRSPPSAGDLHLLRRDGREKSRHGRDVRRRKPRLRPQRRVAVLCVEARLQPAGVRREYDDLGLHEHPGSRRRAAEKRHRLAVSPEVRRGTGRRSRSDRAEGKRPWPRSRWRGRWLPQPTRFPGRGRGRSAARRWAICPLRFI